MAIEPNLEQHDRSSHSMAHAVQTCVQFLRVVRFRQSVLIATVIVFGMLGGLYYATATRLYQAKASLLVLQTGADVTNTTMTAEGVRQGLMPTYERLFSSAVVLEGAIEHLQPADRIDFEGVTEENWPNVIRSRLSASTVRLTNIIEISYRSKAPRSAVAVVNAVLQSYLEFMDKTHRGTAGDLLNVFTREKAQIEERLAKTQVEVLAARRKFGDLGIKSHSNVVHPMVQRVLDINQGLIKAQQARLETQATLAAIEAAIRNGENLDQHLLSLEGTLGRELLLAGLGFSQYDVEAQGKLDEQLRTDRAELRRRQEYLGPNHPDILSLQEQIRLTEGYQSNYQRNLNARLNGIRQQQLGPMLVQMVRQRLDEAHFHEAALRANFEQARGEAVALIDKREQLELMEHDLKFFSDLRDALLNKIASVDLRQQHGDIRTRVISEPMLPKAPVWPKLSLIGFCSLMAGLGTGLGLIYILDILDDRFRTPEEMRMQVGAPLLAMVRKLEELHTLGLEGVQAFVSPDDPACEAFRTLRTSLAFSGHDTSRLVISSPEPGDGKTTVLANLAVSFCQAGRRTLIIDADMRRPGLSSQMGLKGQSGLSDLLAAPDAVAKTAGVCVHTLTPGLDFIAAGRRRAVPTELLTTPRMAELLAWAESQYDQILIDSPPALAATDASIIGRLVDGAVLVMQPAKNRRRLVLRAAESFTSFGVNLLGLVVNRVGADKQDAIYAADVQYGYGYGGEEEHSATGHSANASDSDSTSAEALAGLQAVRVGTATYSEKAATAEATASMRMPPNSPNPKPSVIPRRVA